MKQFFRLPSTNFGLLSKLKNIIKSVDHPRDYSEARNSGFKVTVVGANGPIGEPLCLMLKQSPLIDELCLSDTGRTHGMAVELNHIDTDCKVTAVEGNEMTRAFHNASIVVVAATAPGSIGVDFDKMFTLNAPLVKNIVTNFAKSKSKAFLAINTNPITSLVPMAAEILKQHGAYNPNTLFGITTLDIVRANTFVAQTQGLEPECVVVPVIGGNTPDTIVPLLSQTTPCAELTDDEKENLTCTIRMAHSNLIQMSSGHGTPLSAAFAASRFIISLVKAAKGATDILEYAFVPSKVHPHVNYFASPIVLGPSGIARRLEMPKMTDYEQCLLNNSTQYLMKDARIGERYVGVKDAQVCDPCNPTQERLRCPPDYCQMQSIIEGMESNSK